MTRGNQPRAQDGEDETSLSSAALAEPYPAGGWLPAAVQLPDGAWIRGRGLRHGDPGGPCPDFGLYLGVDYRPGWPHEHLAWPDFWLPRDARRASGLLQHVHRLALDGRRVEIACRGGRGRTGTALAAGATITATPWRPRGNATGYAVSPAWSAAAKPAAGRLPRSPGRGLTPTWAS